MLEKRSWDKEWRASRDLGLVLYTLLLSPLTPQIADPRRMVLGGLTTRGSHSVLSQSLQDKVKEYSKSIEPGSDPLEHQLRTLSKCTECIS